MPGQFADIIQGGLRFAGNGFHLFIHMVDQSPGIRYRIVQVVCQGVHLAVYVLHQAPRILQNTF